MKLNNLNDLFIHELQDIFHAEKQIMKALPKMIKASTSDKLKNTFEDHLELTGKQVKRLEKVFDMLGLRARGTKCLAMEGIINECESIMNEQAASAVMDAALIACAQRVEHYEIAAYGTACTYAKQLGLTDVLNELVVTLEEEKRTDKHLTVLAKKRINVKAE